MIETLEQVRERLPAAPDELVRCCRESEDLGGIAVSLRLDLTQLNTQIALLGAPYAPVDLTERHVATHATFLNRKEPLVRESIRQTFRASFEAGEDLTGYVAALGAPRPVLPGNYGRTDVDLPQARMQEWLDRWMENLGVQPCAELPSPRYQLDGVRDANLKQLRSQVPEMRVAVLARGLAGAPIRKIWASVVEAEAAVTNAALSRGWADFDRLDEKSYDRLAETIGAMARGLADARRTCHYRGRAGRAAAARRA